MRRPHPDVHRPPAVRDVLPLLLDACRPAQHVHPSYQVLRLGQCQARRDRRLGEDCQDGQHFLVH